MGKKNINIFFSNNLPLTPSKGGIVMGKFGKAGREYFSA